VNVPTTAAPPELRELASLLNYVGYLETRRERSA
jgi:hypothetical protein